jgi:transposase InsO family protein
MQIGFKYHNCQGFGRLYDYAIKQSYMITREAKQRIKILEFWRKYGLEATQSAFGAKQSTLYLWQKILRDNNGKIESLNPKSQARIHKNKREINISVLKEIRRLRLEVCPNMGKAKVKIFLDRFCKINCLPVYSESKIGRIIKEKKIYHHRQKIGHNGEIKIISKQKKLRKPQKLIVNEPGDLVEIDTVVRFISGMKRYIVTAIDTFGRPAFAYTYNRAGSTNTRDFFQKLEAVMPFPIKAVQTDNGSEFHLYFRDYLKERNITHYYNYPGRPYRNGHIEKFNRSLQEEFVDTHESWLTNTDEFNRKLIDWLLWYNTERPHWSLNLASPVDYLLNNGFVSNMCWTNTASLQKRQFYL